MRPFPIAKLLLIATLILSFSNSPGKSQSFNCRYAKAADEILICQNNRLSTLDEQMSSEFFTLRNSLSGRQARQLDEEQSLWLRQRMSCGRDVECVTDAYERRIRQLKAY
jgi:uncharacterized protein